METLIRGVFERQRFLDLLHHFIVFEEDPDSGALHKIIAGYHQFHAVNAAVEETVRASGMTETGSVLREDSQERRSSWMKFLLLMAAEHLHYDNAGDEPVLLASSDQR